MRGLPCETGGEKGAKVNERVTLDGFMNMKPDGTVELLDGDRNVVARLYSRASNDLEKENEDLRQENAKLRKLLTDVRGLVSRLKEEATTFDHEPTFDDLMTGLFTIGVCGAVESCIRESGVEVHE